MVITVTVIISLTKERNLDSIAGRIDVFDELWVSLCRIFMKEEGNS